MEEDPAERIKRLDRERYKQNREKRIAYQKEWNKRNPDKCREYYQRAYYGKKPQLQQTDKDGKPLDPLLGPPKFQHHAGSKIVKFD